jgi:hypothetical protein
MSWQPWTFRAQLGTLQSLLGSQTSTKVRHHAAAQCMPVMQSMILQKMKNVMKPAGFVMSSVCSDIACLTGSLLNLSTDEVFWTAGQQHIKSTNLMCTELLVGFACRGQCDTLKYQKAVHWHMRYVVRHSVELELCGPSWVLYMTDRSIPWFS